MCLQVSNKAKEIVAPENYIVYKILEENMRSPWESFLYKLNKIYTAKLGKSKGYIEYHYNQGLHYCKTLSAVKTYARSEGWSFKRLVVECIVPKGSTYINNDSKGLGVTNKLKIVKIYGTIENGIITKNNS